jgi:hypothetical protein
MLVQNSRDYSQGRLGAGDFLNFLAVTVGGGGTWLDGLFIAMALSRLMPRRATLSFA